MRVTSTLRARATLLALALALGALGLTGAAPGSPAAAARAATSPYSVNVGYADTTRPSPVSFPTPWAGSPNVVMQGCTTSCSFDAGAVEIVNNTHAKETVNYVYVDMSTCHFDIWTHGVALPAGDEMIFTQTAASAAGGCTPGSGEFDTSDIGPNGGGVSCTQDGVIPQVTVSVNGTQSVFADTGQVLNTGGVDKASCPSGNESEQWTPIGQTPCPGANLSLTPSAQAAVPGGTASFTAKFANSCNTPLAGVTVQLTVSSGPDAGTSTSGTTNAKGDVVLSYPGPNFGVDYVQATIANTAGVITSKTVTVLWETATLVLSPASGLPGATVSFTGTGYGAGEQVSLYLGSVSGQLLTTVTATSGGAISGSFTVPVPTGGPAADAVVALGASSGKQGWAAFSQDCTTEWNNASGGDFNTAADWTGGVPGSSDRACVLLPGTYTVTMTQSNTVQGLILGNAASGSQTLNLSGANADLTLNGPSTINPGGVLAMDSPDGNASFLDGSGTLTNDGTLTALEDNGSTRYIRVNIVNASTGTMSVQDFDTRIDSGTTLINQGSLTVSGQGGLALSGGSTLTNHGKLTASGRAGLALSSSSAFVQAGGTLSGTVQVQDTAAVKDTGGSGGTFVMGCGATSLSGAIQPKQTVTVQGSGCGDAQLSLAGTSVTNHGTLNLDSTDGNYAMLSGSPLVNDGTLASVQDNGGIRYLRTDITNNAAGTVRLGDFDTRMDNGNTFTNDGTFTDSGNGVLAVSGGSTFAQAAGTVSGTVAVQNGGTLADSGGTGGTFLMECGTTSLTGTIPAGQTVTVQGSGCGDAQANLAGTSVTSDGTLNLDSTDGNWAMIAGSPLVNDGTLATLQDGGGTRYIRADVTNAPGGTVSIGASDTQMDNGNTFINNGAYSDAGAGVLLMSAAGTFGQSGGTVSGTVGIDGGSTLADSGGTGGTFLIECDGGTLSGTIPATQTVTVQGNGCGSPSLTLAGTSVTNDGTLNLDSTDGNYALVAGSPLVNDGTFAAEQDGGGTRYIRANVTNATGGMVTVGAADTRMDNGNTLANSGTVSVSDGAALALSNGSAFSQGAGATLGVTVDAAAAAGYGISGGSVAVGGTLAVTTVGTPAHGSAYSVISGATLTGKFASISSATAYTATYSGSALTLTAK